MGGVTLLSRSLSEIFNDDDSVDPIYDYDIDGLQLDNCEERDSRRQSLRKDEERQWQNSYESLSLSESDFTDDFNSSVQDLLGPIGNFSPAEGTRHNHEHHSNGFTDSHTSKLPSGLPEIVKEPQITIQLTAAWGTRGKTFDMTHSRHYLPSKPRRSSKTRSNKKTKRNRVHAVQHVIDHIISSRDFTASCDLSDVSLDSFSSDGNFGGDISFPESIEFSTLIKQMRSLDRTLKADISKSAQDTAPKRPSRRKSLRLG